jgi:hypothetical protein
MPTALAHTRRMSTYRIVQCLLNGSLALALRAPETLTQRIHLHLAAVGYDTPIYWLKPLRWTLLFTRYVALIPRYTYANIEPFRGGHCGIFAKPS